MRRIILMLLMGLSAASALAGGSSTTAYFTSSVASSGNTFTARTLTISATPVSAVFTVANLYPGGTIHGDLTLANTAADSVNATYDMTLLATNPDSKDLRGNLNLLVRAGTCASPGSTLYNSTMQSGVSATTVFTSRTLNQGTTDNLCMTISLPTSAANGLQAASTTATLSFGARQS
jgi:predicted ribosomally synthesized peptide with SipW-like signal peptide